MVSAYLSVGALVLASVALVLAARQSPIDIKTNEAVLDVKLAENPLQFKNYHSSKSIYYLSNSGHGCQVTLGGDAPKPLVRGGPLHKSFALEQMHFHWGKHNGVGSEHFLNGKAASMEVHLVHWNTKYDNYTQASGSTDGLAVLGFFMECADCSERRLCGRRADRPARPRFLRLLCSARDRLSTVMSLYLPESINARIRSKLFPTGKDYAKNADFQNLVDLIPEIKDKKGDKVQSEADLLQWVVPYLQSGDYFTYAGSLTTEPYTENVRWIMYRQPIDIGSSQIKAFREIENEHEHLLLTNRRELQSMSGRTVHYVPAISSE